MDIVEIEGLIIGITGIVITIVIAIVIWYINLIPPSSKGKKCLSTYIPQEFNDTILLREWETFDLKFIDKCFGYTHRGLVFKSDSCKEFLSDYISDPEKLKLFLTQGEKIYTHCSKTWTWICKDKKYFTIIAFSYRDLVRNFDDLLDLFR